MLGQAVGAVLGAGEHQHLLPVVRTDQVGQQRRLALAIHAVNHLRNALGSGVARRNLDTHRIVQQVVGQRLDLVGVSRGEQQVLTLFGQQREDLFDVVDKAHVEHAVGFIEHQHFNIFQLERALADMVEQAPRGGDQDIHAAFQRRDLRVDLDAAKDHRGFQIQMFAVGLHTLADLGGQLAGRRQHQGADLVRLGRLGATIEQLQQRQGKAGGLAGAGLCAGQYILALQNGRDRLLLDRGGFCITLFCDSTQNVGLEAEFIKCHSVISVITLA